MSSRTSPATFLVVAILSLCGSNTCFGEPGSSNKRLFGRAARNNIGNDVDANSDSIFSTDGNDDDLSSERNLLEDFFQKKIFDDDDGMTTESEEDDVGDESLFRKVLQEVNDFSEGEEDEEYDGEESEKGALYDAYNLLHTLAQDFQKPFDAPAVLVVGHQSSGKSALIEALMGFQFNAVGGGTKTRRPIALRMQYNPRCHSPKCFLLDDDDGVERPKSLAEIQEHINSENLRLEKDSV